MILLAAAVTMTAASQAQTVVEGVRFGQSEISGTARYRSMAGAFGALGGDPSVMNDNPAGLAIYRNTNLFSITPHLNVTTSKSLGSESWKEKETHTSISNFSTIFSFKTGLDNIVNFNIGIGFERRMENLSKLNTILDNTMGSFGDFLTNQANYYLQDILDPNYSFSWVNSGTTAPILSMLGYNTLAFIDDADHKHRVINPMDKYASYQRLYMKEHTRLDHYNISGAMNINDVLFVGATLTVTDFNSTIISDFSEDYSYDYNGSYIYYENDTETKGTGIGFNLGVIWTPVDQLRVGAAIHTPTYTTLEEIYYGGMEVYDDELAAAGEKNNLWNDSFDDWWRYEMKTPWEYQLSAAYIVGTRGLISLEYDLRDFKSIQMRHNRSYGLDDGYFREVNKAMKDYTALQHTIKMGGEYRLNKQISLRAGYARMTSPYTSEALNSRIDPKKQIREDDVYQSSHVVNVVYYTPTKPNYQTVGGQQYVTTGLGWRGKMWSIDFAYMLHHIATNVAAYSNEYSTVEPIEVEYLSNTFDLTFGYRF